MVGLKIYQILNETVRPMFRISVGRRLFIKALAVPIIKIVLVKIKVTGKETRLLDY